VQYDPANGPGDKESDSNPFYRSGYVGMVGVMGSHFRCRILVGYASESYVVNESGDPDNQAHDYQNTRQVSWIHGFGRLVPSR